MTTSTTSESSDRELLAAASRQSPIALVFIAWRFVRRVGVINLGVAFAFAFSGRLPIALGAIAAILVTLLLALSTLNWWRFTFRVSGDELVVTTGVFTVERLAIPLGRVQSVGIEQKLLHRAVGLVSASVDTAGSDETEFTIDAVDRSRADALQRLATGGDGRRSDGSNGRRLDGEASTVDAGSPGPHDQVLLRRTPRELVIVGLTSMPWAGLVALLPLVAFADDIGELVGFEFAARATATEQVGDLSVAGAIVAGIALVVMATMLGLALQVARTLLADWDLTLVRTSTGVRRTAGLANTTSTASTLRRIQAVTTHRSPIQRRLGIRRATLETIGTGDLVIPGSTDGDVQVLRALALSTTAPTPLDRTVSHWIVFARVRNAVVVGVIAGLVASFSAGWWGALAAAVPLIAWGLAEWSWRQRRWGIESTRIAERRRLISETTRELDVVKTQAVTVERSFFERRRGLASVHLRTASGSVTIPMIDDSDAEDLRDRLLHLVESSNRPGM